MSSIIIFTILAVSRSLRARGLKYVVHNHFYNTSRVALFTGAWIEIICPLISFLKSTPVALFTGAWIEIERYKPIKDDGEKSRSLRARGLKYNIPTYFNGYVLVALFTGAWIEI